MIKIIKPYIEYDEVVEDFRAVFESGMFTKGRNVEGFRQELVTYTGARFAHLTTSATTALSACLRMLDVGPGDDVIVSDFSFPASANVIEDTGARPVFADVSVETFNMTPDALRGRLSRRTKAVMFVDALGNPSGLHEIKEVCRTAGVPLIEDAACALGSSEHGEKVGAIADITCFSFHPRKLICTGEGGAITTSREEWSRWLDIKLNHGASGMRGAGLDFVEFGYNYRMSELQAVMGRKQLAKLDAIVSERNAVRDDYIAALLDLGFEVQRILPGVVHNVQSLVFRVPSNCDRDALIAAMRRSNVESTLGTYSLSATTYFLRKYSELQPVASMLERNTITLPCYAGLDVNEVVEAIRRSL